MTIKDIISPFAYSVWQFVGYGVFIVAAWFILFALCRAARDAQVLKIALPRLSAPRQPRVRVYRLLLFPNLRGGASRARVSK
jgi:hypothetical protein